MQHDPSSKPKPRWSNRCYVLALSLALLVFAMGAHDGQPGKRFAVPVSVYPVQSDRILL